MDTRRPAEQMDIFGPGLPQQDQPGAAEVRRAALRRNMRRALARLEGHELELAATIQEARAAGWSWREIEAATGLPKSTLARGSWPKYSRHPTA